MYFECHLLKEIPNGSHIEEICRHAILSVDPYQCIRDRFKLEGNILIINNHLVDLRKKRDIYVIGFGKASIPMAAAVEDVLGDEIKIGAVISKQIIENNLKKIICLKGDHPIPAENSLISTKKLISIVEDLNPDDLVICLISGGGSSLFTLPDDKIGLKGMQAITDFLIKSGASIQEINSVRKCIDQVKGGGLAKIIRPAHCIALILSDVLGDPLNMIASGPTVNEPTTFENAVNVIRKYKYSDCNGEKIWEFLNKGLKGYLSKPIKLDSKINLDEYNLVIGSLSIALKSAEESAKSFGYLTRIISAEINGEAREIGKELGKLTIETAKSKEYGDPPICLIAGGETTVTVKGKGMGGRNQELALGAALELNGYENCILVALATDGEDSTTDAAGAMVTGNTLRNGLKNHLDPEVFLKNNDSYHYFMQVGGLIKTGPTGTNVNDMVLMFVL